MWIAQVSGARQGLQYVKGCQKIMKLAGGVEKIQKNTQISPFLEPVSMAYNSFVPPSSPPGRGIIKLERSGDL